MKKTIFMFVVLLSTTLLMAKDIRTAVFTTSPEMHCANCEKRIQSSLRFEKGVKEITTNLKTKTVTVKYDAEKTTVDNLIKGFTKIGYQAAVAATCGKKTCPEGTQEECCKKEVVSCCNKEKE